MIAAHRLGVMALLTVALGVLLPQRMTENSLSLAGTTGPVSLTPSATRVTLASRSQDPRALDSAIGSLGQRRVSLLLYRVRAEQQPGVLYQVYLDLPPGAAPDPDGPYFVGNLNFFNAVRPPGAETPAAGDGAFNSFDVTDVLTRLRALGRLTEAVTVTFVPIGTPAADAKPTIANIRLMVHRPE